MNNPIKCPYCDKYESNYKANVYRHCRQQHADSPKPVLSPKPSQHIMEAPETTLPPPPPVRFRQEEEQSSDDLMDINDIEDIIDKKLEILLKERDVDVPPQMRKSAIKQFMNGRSASVIAGLCCAYLLFANAPLIMTGVRLLLSKKDQIPTLPVGFSHEKMMEMVMARQQQKPMEQVPQNSKDSNKEPLCPLED